MDLTPTASFSPAHEARVSSPLLRVRERAVVLTCMHGQVDCDALFGAHARGQDLPILRNPGARVTEDAVRSLLLAYEAFGAQRWIIVQHSDCGMALLSDEITENLWSGAGPRSEGRALTRSDRVGSPEHAQLGRLLLTDRARILAADLTRLRAHPRVPRQISVHGYFLDLCSGQLQEVAAE